MSFFAIIALAAALGMDAFAVAVAAGIALKSVDYRQTFRLSWHFGLFQFMMPLIGWAAGRTVAVYIEAFDHWIAFGLLSFIGAKMLWEAFKDKEEGDEFPLRDPTKGATLVMLSVATSIDALAVGLSLSLLNAEILWPAFVIGVVALVFTAVGLHLGKFLASSRSLGRFSEILGGLVLISIGVHILIEHGVF